MYIEILLKVQFSITNIILSDLPQLQFNLIHPAGPGLGICVPTSLSQRESLRILAFLYRLLHMLVSV